MCLVKFHWVFLFKTSVDKKSLKQELFVVKNQMRCKTVWSCSCWILLPFHSETQLFAGLLYLVLSLTVQHVCSWDSLDGQDNIPRTQVGWGRLTAWSDLHKKEPNKSYIKINWITFQKFCKTKVVAQDFREICSKRW